VLLGNTSNSHYENDFGVSSAEGAGNTKIVFLKARHRRAFKKTIFIMRIAVATLSKKLWCALCYYVCWNRKKFNKSAKYALISSLL